MKLFLMTVMVGLVTLFVSCQPNVTPTDRNRFANTEVTPPSKTSITFTGMDNLSTVEGIPLISSPLVCSSTESKKKSLISFVDKSNIGNCHLEGSESITLICNPPFKDGHSNLSGELVFTCTIDGVSTSSTVSLSISDLNSSPQLQTPIDQSIFAGNAITAIDINDGVDDEDKDGDPITYTCTFAGGGQAAGTNCTSLPSDSFAFSGSGGTLSWTPSAAAAVGNTKTSYTLTIIGSDDQTPAGTSSVSFKVDVDIVAPPAFSSIVPTSPSSNASPKLIGTASNNTATIKLYSDIGCSQLIGSGAKSDFTGAGISASVTQNGSTTIYARAYDSANNYSTCTSMTTYVHDNIPPSLPTFLSLNPTSPSKTTFTTSVKGSVSVDTVIVAIFTDASCTVSAGSGDKATFTGTGVSSTGASNNTVTFYGKAIDAAANESGCNFLTGFTHDNTPPAIPTFVSFTPASPSASVSTPVIKGGASADTVTVSLFNNSLCTVLIGTGSRSEFISSGITLAATANSSTDVYALAYDSAGNVSTPCALLGNYLHDDTGPTNPTFTSINPLSPSSNAGPIIKGTAGGGATTVKLYTSSLCSTEIGSGTAADYTGAAGITLNMPHNVTTSIYGISFDSLNNASTCISLATYTHDDIAPPLPTFLSLNPASPSKTTFTPSIKGSVSVDTVTVSIFTDASCSVTAGIGDKATFTGAGIASTGLANSTVTFYGKAIDAAANESGCNLLSTYTHDDIVPAAPTFVSFSPASPSASVINPSIIGGASADTVTVTLFNDSSCIVSIGSGTRTQFVGSGIGITGSSNASTDVYAKAYDSAGNVSAGCPLMGSYVHDNTGPSDPTFTSITPTSPASNPAPVLKGGIVGGASSVKVYNNVACTTEIGTGTAADFTGAAGITLAVTQNGSTSIYARSFDSLNNPSALCPLLTTYAHDDTTPAPPTVTLISPSSPSNGTLTPSIKGGAASGDTVSVAIYTDNACTLNEVIGTKAAFIGGGITVSASANATTLYYAKTIDSAGNMSACTYLIAYVHDNTAPDASAFTFSSFDPASPSATVTNPKIIGATSPDTVTVKLYDSGACASEIGSGTRAEYIGAGIQITAAANATTTVFGKTFDNVSNETACKALSNYLHDSIGPADPTYTSLNPLSPSSNTAPLVKGTATGASLVKIYNDASCSNEIGSGSKATYEGAGISISILTNNSTSLYVKAFDALNNGSACADLAISYVHDNVVPNIPAFSSSNPVSPSASSTTPFIIGTSAADVITVELYRNILCTLSLNSGSKASFEGLGIQINVSDDSSTTVYAKTVDAAANKSSCTYLMTYVHDSSTPGDPSFVSISPSSPNNTSTNPLVVGSSDAGTVTVKLYNDGGCSNLIGSGSKASFESTGLSAACTANSLTSIYAKAFNGASSSSNCTLLTSYRHDTIAPTLIATVNDNASFYASTNSTPTISWTDSSDAGSGLLKYQVALGSSAGASDIVTWTDVTPDTSKSFSGISPNLNNGSNYYASVRAVDGVGNTCVATNSDGWRVDVQSPSNVIVSATSCTNSNFIGTWTASADALSGIKNYSFSIGTAAGLSNILAWVNGTSPLNQGGLTMNLGSTYYLNVYSTDNVDNTSDIISAGVECSDLSYSLKAFWRLNEVSGNRSSEVGAHTLTDNNSVLSAAGKIGNAAVFDSGSNQSLSKASHADLASADESFTLSAWVSLDNTNDNNPLIAKWSAPANKEYLLEWKNTGAFRFWVKNSSVDFNVVGATNGTWYHVVAWYDKDNLIGISVNNQTAQTAAQAGGVTDLGNPFEIGHNSDSGIYFKGKIDAVGFWKRVLSSKERGVLYNSGNGYEY